MPMITIKILKGHSKETKQKIVSALVKTIHETTGIAPDNIWTVFEDVEPEHWYAGEKDCT